MTYGVNAPMGLVPKYRYNSGSLSIPMVKQYIYSAADGSTDTALNLYMNDPIAPNPTHAQTIVLANGVQYGTIVRYSPGYTPGNAGVTTFSLLPILGSFQGVRYTPPNALQPVYQQYWRGGTPVQPGSLIEVLACIEADIVYTIQVSVYTNAAANEFLASPTFPDTNADATHVTAYTLAGGVWSNFALNLGGGTNFTTVLDPYGNAYTNNPTDGNPYTGSAFYLDVNTTSATTNNAVTPTEDYNKTTITLPLKVIGFDDGNVLPGVINTDTDAPYTVTNTPFMNVLVIINNHVTKTGTAGVTIV